VSVLADPSTGVAVYDTFVYAGWSQFGGTSVGAPVIASVYALAGNASSLTAASYAYAHTSALNDVVSGSNDNGNACTSAMCVAQSGWDGPPVWGPPTGRVPSSRSEELGSAPLFLARTHVGWARALIARGRPEDLECAQTMLEQARDTAARLGPEVISGSG
jgi:hypothetical protein